MKFRVPVLKPREVIQVLSKVGFIKARQTGSHLILRNPQTGKIIPVPMHAKALKRGLLFGIIKEAGLSVEDFLKLLKRK